MTTRTYLSVVAMIDDPEIAAEWVRTQTAIYRRDPDVVDVEARVVVDTDQGPIVSFLDTEPVPVPRVTDHPYLVDGDEPPTNPGL